jgi:hypothetical protein
MERIDCCPPVERALHDTAAITTRAAAAKASH